MVFSCEMIPGQNVRFYAGLVLISRFYESCKNVCKIWKPVEGILKMGVVPITENVTSDRRYYVWFYIIFLSLVLSIAVFWHNCLIAQTFL